MSSKIWPFRLWLISGHQCPSVATVGFALGGGIGPSTAQYGAAVDNIVSAQIVLGDGRIVEASEQDNPNLFWGIRGGTVSVLR